jgi:hypothetical protein
MKEINCVRLESQGDNGNSLVARFANRQEAQKAKSKAAGYGSEIRDEVIRIYDTAIEFAPDLDDKSRESGLAKLTAAERRALGLEAQK